MNEDSFDHAEASREANDLWFGLPVEPENDGDDSDVDPDLDDDGA